MSLVRRTLVSLVAASAVGAGLLRLAGLRRFEVEGRSMLQAFKPGDRLFVERVTYRLRRPRIGEVVVLRPPGSNGRLDIKRIAAGPGAEVQVGGAPDFLGNDEWYVLGDNLDESTDSRELGAVKTSDIVGRVWFRY